METVTCSSPGKVLITGGYMVLERPNSGLVLTVNARFYCQVSSLNRENGDDNWIVEVVSPQFANTTSYVLNKTDFSLHSTREKSNPYTERSIMFTLMAISKLIPQDQLHKTLSRGIRVTITGDNDFYSQRDRLHSQSLPMTSASLASLSKCLPVLSTLDELKKTGLGSSAALVTSLVASLLHFFGAVHLKSLEDNSTKSQQPSSDVQMVHNLAQYCHCLAQGKIGSGFDVCSAAYGSQRYVRFSPSVIAKSLKTPDSLDADSLLQMVNSKEWDYEVKTFALPRGLSLILGDPSKGSNTPIMVSQVLKWKENSPEAAATISELVQSNSQVEIHLKNLSDATSLSAYDATLRRCSSLPYAQWQEVAQDGDEASKIVGILKDVRESFECVREYLRKMGSQASVDVEPTSQTDLIDATIQLPGVLISGVPGAGGYDAIFAVLIDGASSDELRKVSSRVEHKWMDMGVLPLILREDPRGVSIDSFPESNK